MQLKTEHSVLPYTIAALVQVFYVMQPGTGRTKGVFSASATNIESQAAKWPHAEIATALTPLRTPGLCPPLEQSLRRIMFVSLPIRRLIGTVGV